jgi:hypothetical protein
MSDALSDIRKADRNRSRYSQIEYEKGISAARTDGWNAALKEVWNKCYKEMNFQSTHRMHYDPEDSYIPSLECGEIPDILESFGLCFTKAPEEQPRH